MHRADDGHPAFAPSEGLSVTDIIRSLRTRSSAADYLDGSSKVEARRWKAPLLVVGLALCVLTLGGATTGQESGTPAPDRIGPEWNWRQHEPTQGITRHFERAEGVAPSLQEDRREAHDVDQLYRELMGRSPSASPQSSAALAPAGDARHHQDVAPW
jgi:hypothetical protein